MCLVENLLSSKIFPKTTYIDILIDLVSQKNVFCTFSFRIQMFSITNEKKIPQLETDK